MENLMKPFVLDIIIIFFVMIMIILGYKKGFVIRLYDFVTTLLVWLIARIIAIPLSKVWIIYSIDSPLQKIGETVNQFFIFVIVFVVLKLLCKVLGFFIKPLIRKIFSILKITGFLDNLLGVILSLLESIILVYLALVIIVSPLFNGGNELIEKSVLGDIITKVVPVYTSEMMKFDIIQDLIDVDLDTKDTTCVTIVTKALFQLDENRLIDNETMRSFIINYYKDIDNVSLNQETYDMIEKLCQRNNIENKKILEGIIVSDENEE